MDDKLTNTKQRSWLFRNIKHYLLLNSNLHCNDQLWAYLAYALTSEDNNIILIKYHSPRIHEKLLIFVFIFQFILFNTLKRF